MGPCALILAACSSDVSKSTPSASTPDGADASVPNAPAPIPVVPGDGNEDLTSLKYEPHFDPDFNTLTANPWVEPVTPAQADEVIVTPTSLIYVAANHPEIKDWAAGRVVVSAPGSKGSVGTNPFGFARRVVSVTESNGQFVVATESVGLEDLVTGDFQSTFDPATAEDVDLSKVDLDWAIANLYTNDAPAFEPGGTPLLDDYSLSMDTDIGNPFWGSVGKFISGAAKAVGNAVTNAVAAITPASFDGSFSLAPEMKGGTKMPLFTNMNYKKQLKGGKYPVELFIKGSAGVDAFVSVNPGFQVGATIPNPINKNAPKFAAWMNIDARSDVRVDLDVNLEAGIASAGGAGGGELADKLNGQADFAQDVLGRARESLLGDPDMKPAGGWRKPVFLSKPSTKVIMAGPVPVVIVSTVQVDVECGFEAKASITGKIQYEQVNTFKFSARYEKGGSPTLSGPTFDKRTVRNVELTGGGKVAVTCGLIPRINTMLYDTAGLNVGIRGSLVAQAAYESKCAETTTTPTAEVAVGLYANVGVQLGARLQAPGSSFLGTAGQKAGFDIGPIEPWNTQFPIFEKTWDLAKGLGYCTPTCKNGKKDNAETDADCGGGACETCATGKSCKVNSDCANGGGCVGGKCKAAPCFDGVISGTETDIDCGGTCSATCANGKFCQVNKDCASGACNRTAGVGHGVCVQNHCGNGIKDSDESGVDCGGSSCNKCATGKESAVAADCASGISDDTYCVASTCSDRKVTTGETDVDCGGPSSCRRCGVGQACSAHSDCSKGPYALLCIDNKCSRPTNPGCTDGNWTNDETDVDCGGSCGPTCQISQMCKGGADCVNGKCGNGTCVECLTGAECPSGTCNPNGTCAPIPTYTVGGSVSGLADGESVGLALNGDVAAVTKSTNDAFVFDKALLRGTDYNVTVTSAPANKACVVRNGTGTLSADVSDVTILCGARSYKMTEAPNWGTHPQVMSCVEACASLFGGTASNYACSVDATTITHTAWVSGYGTGQYCHSNGTPASETFKSGTTYGGPGDYSAYVSDHCYTDADVNYCFPK